MESFSMLHGTIVFVGNSIMALRFISTEGYESEAVAVKEVCYVGGKQSEVLHLNFKRGQQVPFSAVRDPQSVAPEVWKTIVLWTTYKPQTFSFCDWDMMVSKFYTNRCVIQNILVGIVDTEWNEDLERRAIRYLNTKLVYDMRQTVVHNINDTDLNALTDNADEGFEVYIQSQYGSVSEFMLYHSEIFRLSVDGEIYPLKPGKKFDQYLDYLSTKIKEDRYYEDCVSDSVERERTSTRDVHKVFRLEKKAVAYFAEKLRGIQHNLGIVFCLSSKTLEELLDRAPDEITFYITKTYMSLTNFLSFHRQVFLIGPCSTVYPNTVGKLKVYLEERLQEDIPNDDFADLLYEMFVQQHEMYSKNKGLSENKTDAQKRQFKYDPPQPHSSQNTLDSARGEEKCLEEKRSIYTSLIHN